MADPAATNEPKCKDPRGSVVSPRHRLAELIAAGRTHAEAAKILGKSLSTVNKWAIQPEVKKEVAALRDNAVENGLGLLFSGFRTAVGTLVTLSKSGTPADSIRLGAARAVCDLVLKATDQITILRRLDALESQAATMETFGRP